MNMLYAIAFLVSVFSLVGWSVTQDKKGWSGLFRLGLFLGLGTYLTSLVVVDAPSAYKFNIAFRDLIVLGVSGFVFLWFAKRRLAVLIGSVALVIGMVWFYQAKLKPTFPFLPFSNLDPNAELLVELTPGYDVASLQAILDQYNLSSSRAFFPEDVRSTELDDYITINIPEAHIGALETIKAELRASGLVDWLEENEQVQIAPIETRDPRPIKERFGINDPKLELLWGFEAMEVNKLYEYIDQNKIKPKKKALIAILDTGVDSKHEDIKANFKSIQKSSNDDPQGHGTHCAGIAASVSNNGVGVASFSKNNEFVRVSSIKVLNSYGMGTQKKIIDGIILAADKGADVISMSLGGPSNSSKQTAYARAIKYANNKGAIVVVAAGNSNRNAKNYAPVNAPGVIGVSAIDQNLNRAVFSNYVQDIKMAVAAPGVGIHSTIPDNKYATFNGTSMATPYVAGLVGVMKSIKPSLTTEQAYKILNNTGKDTKNTEETGQLIFPHKAIESLTK